MESIQNLINTMEQVGEEQCKECGRVYKLYKTPVGVSGGCKPCEDKKFKEKLNLPTVEDYRESKEKNFILSFERVSSDLEKATMNSYKDITDSQKEAKQAAINFITKFDGKHSLALSGAPGLGKSHLAYAICKALRKQGYKTLFIKSTDLLEKIRGTYGGNGLAEEDIFNMIYDLDLLVLDDIGSEYVKKDEKGHESWASDVLYKVMDSRLEKSTICTTNYTESELEAKYGKNGVRITDRMMDMAKGIRLIGDSYRKKERF